MKIPNKIIEIFSRIALIITLGLSIIRPIYAHDSRPLYVDIQEISNNIYKLQWKVPPSVPNFNVPNITLDAQACESSPLIKKQILNNLVFTTKLYCKNGIGGQKLNIKYPLFNPDLPTLIKVSWLNKGSNVISGAASEKDITLPNKENPFSVFKEYLKLGMEHILSGYDHLLFVTLLVFITLGNFKKMLLSLTGFTLAHSITLAISALNIFRLPIPAVETLIAFSVFFLSIELIRGNSSSLTYKKPMLVSFIFGLLHGFGFASALQEIGLPQIELLSALVSFNVGVEIGQFIFATFVLIVFYLALQVFNIIMKTSSKDYNIQHIYILSIGYFAGIVSLYWTIQRMVI
ncbi:HupE/UreJ family protein [Candidatus Hepatincola sp. Av]